MKINFVNPTYSDPYGQWDISSLKSSSPPLGLLSLASVARKFGHEVSITDCTVGDTFKFSDLYAITAMTLQVKSAAEIAKTFSPNILGGSHITAEPYATVIKYPQFDAVLIGEGEQKFSEVIGDSFKLGTLDDIPFPAFDLVDLRKYRVSPIGTRSREAIGLVTSRGCFGKCTFCSRTVFGNKVRCHSSKYVLDLMDKLNTDFGISDFLFYDDLFTGNRPRLAEICNALLARDYTWSCCSRVDTINLDILKLMKKAGCLMIEYGIESGCQEILDSMRKCITLEKIRHTIATTRKAGILSKGNFIFGYFGETESTLKQTIQFIKTLGLDYFQHTYMTPLPGTKAWDIADQYGKFDKDWSKCNTFSVNFVPKGITHEKMVEMSKKAFGEFYFNPVRIFKELFRGSLWLKFKALWKAVFR